LRTKVTLKHFSDLLNDFGLTKPLSEEADGSSVWNTIHMTQSNKLLKASPVIDLKFKLFIAEIEKLLKNQNFEECDRIAFLLNCIDLALLRLTPFKQRPK